MQKKFPQKSDFISILFLFILLIAAVGMLIFPNKMYGSEMDWQFQHTVFPDYLRQLYYDTGDIFPDFAMNLGGGQNIYNIVYYGLFNPLILPSYLFPTLEMTTYISIISIVAVLSATIIMYAFFRKKDVTPFTSFCLSVIFMFSGGMFFHSHRHIMFMLYMPFLILALWGVDKKLEEGKNALLSIAIFLIIMTSYYYSISAIIATIIYGVYRYIALNKSVRIKSFIIDGINFISPVFVGVLMSTFLILPTFYVILTNRTSVNTDENLLNLLLPAVNLHFILYRYYGIGLGLIGLISIIYLLTQRREKRFLGIMLALPVVFPIITYVLNGFMYVEGKILIPFLPLMIISIKEFLVWSSQVLNRKVLMRPLMCLLMISSVSIGLIGSSMDDYVEERALDSSEYENIVREIISGDDGFYRISTSNMGMSEINTVADKNHNISTLYSSTTNLNYHEAYFDIFNNNHRNRSSNIISETENPIFNIVNGSKYIVSKKGAGEFNTYGHEEVEEIAHEEKNENETDNNNDNSNFNDIGNENDGLVVYENRLAFPIIYGSSNIFSTNYFGSLTYPYNNELLLEGVVVENANLGVESIKTEFNFEEVHLPEEFLIEFKTFGDSYEINGNETETYEYKLPYYMQGKILIINFENNSNETSPGKDMTIGINDQNNRLTMEDWKYHNGNYNFNYVFASSDLDMLTFQFSKGLHSIENVQIFVGELGYLDSVSDGIIEAQINDVHGDIISGEISMGEDGYLVTSIPYSEGFELTVNGERIEIEKVNGRYVGAELSAGDHEFTLEFKAPLKNAGIVVSSVGIILFGFLLYLETQ